MIFIWQCSGVFLDSQLPKNCDKSSDWNCVLKLLKLISTERVSFSAKWYYIDNFNEIHFGPYHTFQVIVWTIFDSVFLIAWNINAMEVKQKWNQLQIILFSVFANKKLLFMGKVTSFIITCLLLMQSKHSQSFIDIDRILFNGSSVMSNVTASTLLYSYC